MSLGEIDGLFSEKYADKSERLNRLEILAEILYQKAFMENNGSIWKENLVLSLGLFELVSARNRTY